MLLSNIKPPSPLMSDLAAAVNWGQELEATSAVQPGRIQQAKALLISRSMPFGRHSVDLTMLVLTQFKGPDSSILNTTFYVLLLLSDLECCSCDSSNSDLIINSRELPG